MDGINILIEEKERAPSPLLSCEDRMRSLQPGRRPSFNCQCHEDFQPLELRGKISVVYKPPSLWYFVIVARMD